MTLQRVFVYGTLKYGGSNHHLLSRSRLLGRCHTPACYRMLDLGDYPGIVEGGATAISGEVYEVSPATLEKLDELEDYPLLYTRKLITTPWGESWIYILNEADPSHPPVEGGHWRV